MTSRPSAAIVSTIIHTPSRQSTIPGDVNDRSLTRRKPPTPVFPHPPPAAPNPLFPQLSHDQNDNNNDIDNNQKHKIVLQSNDSEDVSMAASAIKSLIPTALRPIKRSPRPFSFLVTKQSYNENNTTISDAADAVRQKFKIPLPETKAEAKECSLQVVVNTQRRSSVNTRPFTNITKSTVPVGGSLIKNKIGMSVDSYDAFPTVNVGDKNLSNSKLYQKKDSASKITDVSMDSLNAVSFIISDNKKLSDRKLYQKRGSVSKSTDVNNDSLNSTVRSLITADDKKLSDRKLYQKRGSISKTISIQVDSSDAANEVSIHEKKTEIKNIYRKRGSVSKAKDTSVITVPDIVSSDVVNDKKIGDKYLNQKRGSLKKSMGVSVDSYDAIKKVSVNETGVNNRGGYRKRSSLSRPIGHNMVLDEYNEVVQVDIGDTRAEVKVGDWFDGSFRGKNNTFDEFYVEEKYNDVKEYDDKYDYDESEVKYYSSQYYEEKYDEKYESEMHDSVEVNTEIQPDTNVISVTVIEEVVEMNSGFIPSKVLEIDQGKDLSKKAVIDMNTHLYEVDVKNADEIQHEVVGDVNGKILENMVVDVESDKYDTFNELHTPNETARIIGVPVSTSLDTVIVNDEEEYTQANPLLGSTPVNYNDGSIRLSYGSRKSSLSHPPTSAPVVSSNEPLTSDTDQTPTIISKSAYTFNLYPENTTVTPATYMNVSHRKVTISDEKDYISNVEENYDDPTYGTDIVDIAPSHVASTTVPTVITTLHPTTPVVPGCIPTSPPSENLFVSPPTRRNYPVLPPTYTTYPNTTYPYTYPIAKSTISVSTKSEKKKTIPLTPVELSSANLLIHNHHHPKRNWDG